MSLRKEKAARLKLVILEATLKLIGKRPFEDLFVDEICEKVKISKVTLFKYFPQKEDILLYYFRIWCLHRAIELKQKPKEGLPGIYYLFDKMSEDVEQYPGIWMSLVAYLADFKRVPKPFPVKPEEKKILYPDVPDSATQEIAPIEQMLEKFVLEAIFRKEITKASATREITQLMNSVLFGSILTAHLQQLSPLKIFFRKSLDMTLRGLTH
jgi:AcrR family transcriptional regulator